MAPHFGNKVVGNDAYDKAVREEAGGASTFGVRVRGAIPADSITNIAKRNTEHGPRVVMGATFQDTKGKETDAVAIDDIRNILAENPTFWDSLYEAELAREDGARPEALDIFYEVERGIKGQGRQDIMDEIDALLKTKRPASARAADLNKLHLRQIEKQIKRQELNDSLLGLETAESLVELEESKATLKKAGIDLKDHTASVDQQLNTIADSEGIERGEEPYTPTGRAKPEGNTNVESQQPGERLGVPKGRKGGKGKSRKAAKKAAE